MNTQTKERLNTFYCDTIKLLYDERNRTPENQNLFRLAFFGLMRNDYPYEITEETIVVNNEDPRRRPRPNSQRRQDDKKAPASKNAGSSKQANSSSKKKNQEEDFLPF